MTSPDRNPSASADQPTPEPHAQNGSATNESTEQLIARRGSPVLSSDGERIGTIEEVFEDASTGTPEWIGLGTGLFYAHRVLVPLRDAAVDDDGVHTVRHTKEAVSESPEAELVDGQYLTPASERTLSAYYGLPVPPDDPEPRLRIRRYPDDKLPDPPDDANSANAG